MLTNKSTNLPNNNYHFNPNPASNINYNLNINTLGNNSPKTSTNNIFYNNTNESLKSNNFNNLNTFSSSKLLNTYNSAGYNLRKFTSLNLQTNASKTQSLNSTNNSKNLGVTTYYSCSTLQSGVASYSIPKTRRFKDSYKVSYCDSIYSLPEFKKSGVSIGNSTRKELFDKKLDIPSTHDYGFTSQFEDNVNKKKGFSISNKIRIKDEKKNFPGPSDYDKSIKWNKQSPCTLKFRKSYFYEDESKQLHNVSPMKYLPARTFTENTRYKAYGISLGLGKRSQDQYNSTKAFPGPGDYNLPSLFDKRLQGKLPIN